MRTVTTHEDLTRSGEIEGSSDRRFGLTCSAALLALGLWPLVHRMPVRRWAIATAAVLLVASLARPIVLAPLNRLWLGLGVLLQRIVSPVMLAALFFLVVTPTGLVLRSLGKDSLRLRFDPQARTYWIERQPPGPAPDTMARQF